MTTAPQVYGVFSYVDATRAALLDRGQGAVVHDFDGPAAGDGGGHVALLGAGDVGVGRNHWLDGRGR